jgi:hypothetical protein
VPTGDTNVNGFLAGRNIGEAHLVFNIIQLERLKTALASR